MTRSIIVAIIIISGGIIGYVTAYKPFPKLSSYIDTKAIKGVKLNWIVKDSTYCIGDCRDYSSSSYSSSSSWGSSSFGGGK